MSSFFFHYKNASHHWAHFKTLCKTPSGWFTAFSCKAFSCRELVPLPRLQHIRLLFLLALFKSKYIPLVFYRSIQLLSAWCRRWIGVLNIIMFCWMNSLGNWEFEQTNKVLLVASSGYCEPSVDLDDGTILFWLRRTRTITGKAKLKDLGS